MDLRSLSKKTIVYLYRRILYVVYRALCCTSIKDNIVVFFSSPDFSDNSRALYDYMLKNRKNYQYVWMVEQMSTFPQYPQTEFVRYFGSVRSVSLLAKAKYIMYSHPLGILFCPRKDQVVVNLWHGIPLKGGKGYVPKNPKFNILLCLSENNISATAKFVGCQDSLLRPWGYPRLDLLISNNDLGLNNPFAPIGFSGKVVVWMPTFRKSICNHLSEKYCDNETGLPLLTNVESIESFNAFLKSINVLVLVKIHPLQADKAVFSKAFANIKFLQDKDIALKGYQLYEILAKSDALLTDYSSVYIDYLVLDKPIGFILDDLEEYNKSRGFLYDNITDYLSGSHIYEYAQLESFCNDLLKNIDDTKDFRNKIKSLMIKYPKGDNCARILDNLKM